MWSAKLAAVEAKAAHTVPVVDGEAAASSATASAAAAGSSNEAAGQTAAKTRRS